MPSSNPRKTQDSEAMKDYRRMLYRLDLATSFTSFEDLFRHFMKETLFDGFIEVRVYSVPSSPGSPTGTFPTPSTRLSFIRDPITGDVVADRLFKPAQRPHDPNNLYRQQYKIAKRYSERPPLLEVFRPFVEPLLSGNKSTLIFEYRAFLEQPSAPSYDEFEVVTRQVPHKLMVGYVGRSEQGPLAIYQLDENIARTAFLDMNPMSFQPGYLDGDSGREPPVVLAYFLPSRMGVSGLVPFLLKKCPTAIENIPNRFQALEGKTIAIDGTLVTQRLFYAPDPRPHRHVLGWYQLIQELRQNKVNVICVFDGKRRIPAKQDEVERRRLLRAQAQARGAWEKSRYERLLSLTQTLRGLEDLPVDHQQEILNFLQIGSRSSLAKEQPPDVPGLRDASQGQGGASDHLEQESSPGVNPLTKGPLSPDEINLTGRALDVIEPGSLLNEISLILRKPPENEQAAENDRTGVPRLPDDDIQAGVLVPEEPVGEDIAQTLPSTETPPPGVTHEVEDPTQKWAGQETLADSSSDHPIDQDHTGLDVPAAESTIGVTGELGDIAEDELSHRWTKAKLKADSLKGEDTKMLTHKILDLLDHYNRTTAIGPDGSIPASAALDDVQDAPAIPISRVQLKYTQEEAKLWEQLVAPSDDQTMDLAGVVEAVEQLATVELPQDELPGDGAALEEEMELPPSERSAKLEEQSGLMVASLARRANPPTALTYAESRLILEAMGIPCIQSYLPYEGEALACSLVLNGLADFVGSEDTDVLMYNAPLLRRITDRKVPLQVIPPSVETGLGLSRAAFIDAAILMGTDFVKRVGGIGPATAWRLMNKYGSIEVMLEQEPKFRPSDVAEYLEQVKVARMIFGTIPPAPAPEDIEPGNWDEQAVYDVMSRFGLQRHLDEDQIIPDALSANYYDNDSESKPF